MPVNAQQYQSVISELTKHHVTLVAVSKTKSVLDIREMYELGQRDFGENYVQELVEKQALLPNDIRWHFIGHLQSNKVKYIAPFVHLIHGVDSLRLLKEINKQAARHGRVIDCLLQVHVAQEATKFGLDEAELSGVVHTLYASGEIQELKNIHITGLMGMASFSDHQETIRNEFKKLKALFCQNNPSSSSRELWTVLSMGMSSDYKTAIEEGSTMVRIGSLLFGAR